MRDRMERLVLFPFAVGCMSESSVGIASQHPRRSSSSGHSPPPLPPKGGHEEADDQTLSDDDQCSKSSWTLPKPSLSVGMNRLFKGFKNFSHLFVYKEDEDEEEEMEIEIGVPTDVKHVSHIGWDDGATNYSIIKLEGNWDHDNHQKLQLLAAKFNHHHQLDDDPSSSTATADPAPIVPDHHDDLNIYIADHDQDSGEIAWIGRYSRSIIKMHGHH